MSLKLLRTLRFDGSDDQVFERAATAGEWAVPAAFAFLDDDDSTLTGKRLQAFRNGFLGLTSFGWATLVEVAELDESEYADVERSLARHLVMEYGAPDIDAALPAAREELEYTQGLCEAEPHTVLSLTREFDPEQGAIVESLRVVTRNAGDHAQVKLFGPE